MEKRKIKILAIDDNPDNLFTISAQIKDIFQDARIITALSGQKGLLLAASENPDVILLDIQMPGMDGYDVCRKLKSDKNLVDIPVVFITALKDLKETRIRALESGAEAFLSKPIDKSELTAQIQAMIKIKTVNIQKRTEKEGLTALVEERTRELNITHNTTLNLLEDLKKENEARKKSEENLRSVAQSANDAIITASNKGIILEWNRGAEKIFGYAKEEIAGKELTLIMPRGYAGKHNEGIKRIEKGGDRHVIGKTVELLGLHKNGNEFPIELSLAEWETGSGKFFTGIIRDITEHKRAVEQLRISEERYRTIVENIGEGIAFVNSAEQFVFVNSAAEEIFGVGPGKLTGMNLNQFISPDQSLLIQEETSKRILGNKSVYELEIFRPNGEKRYLVLTAVPYTDKENGFGGTYGVFRDITNQRLSNDALRENERLLSESQIIARLGSYVWNISTGFWKSSKLLDEIFGIDENYVRSLEGWVNIVHPDWKEIMTDHVTKDVLAKHKRFDKEYKIIRQNDGKAHWVHGLGELEFDNHSNPVRLIGTIQDITERKNAELLLQQKNEEFIKANEELSKAKKKAEESDRLKSAFLTNMSHEIRTPMNGILGFTELLKKPNLSGEEQQKFISIIEKSGDRMLNIINDIINISKIESGQLEVFNSWTNINEQIEFLYSFFKPEAAKKGIKLSVKNSLPANLANIKTDKEKVYAILTNLIKNALKFTNSGSIEFGYTLGSASSPTQPGSDDTTGEPVEKIEPVNLNFFVKDTGIGIQADKIGIIFERFRQGSESLTRAYEGAGLGLSISKGYVELLGGEIWVESETGKGSVFHFSLPCQVEFGNKSAIAKTGAEPENKKQLKGLKILIVEDDQATEMLIELIVEKYQSELLKVRTGTAAVEMCRNHQDIDLVLMDIKMPEMDGYEATRQIRSFNKNVVILAQTAFAHSDEKVKALEAGCNDYIAKPYNQHHLTDLLKKHF
jgi:PAS domain S-box-containing protein